VTGPAPDDGRERRDEGPSLPDPRPFRRLQAVTAALIAVAALVTLLSDRRPAEVRWGAIAGIAVLTLVVLILTRLRGRWPWERGDKNS
jgi:hypothetical protein